MPSSDNISEWKKLSDIDYITQFIKAWLAFNAWMRNHYHDAKSDREIINNIKNNSNIFKNHIVYLLDSKDIEAENFKDSIGLLHDSLERYTLYNNTEKISFLSVFVEENMQYEIIENVNKIVYSAKYDPDTSQLELEVKNSSHKIVFSEKHKYSEYLNKCDFTKLTTSQIRVVKDQYLQLNPRKKESLLSEELDRDNPDDKSTMMGSYGFVKNHDKVAKGLIEILYTLRNILFHGDIVPNLQANTIYQHGYGIMKPLITKL